MVCEAVPGAKGAQRRRKVINTLSYLTFSDIDFQPCNIFALLLVTGTAHKSHSVLVRPDRFPVKIMLLYLTHIHTRLLKVLRLGWSDCGIWFMAGFRGCGVQYLF